MVSSPRGERFDVDVKGLYKKNFWVIRKKELKSNLYYILAFVPEGKENKFFILPQCVVKRGIEENIDQTCERKRVKGFGYDEAKDVHGVTWPFAEANSISWEDLPA
jgi:hypothetical protein